MSQAVSVKSTKSLCTVDKLYTEIKEVRLEQMSHFDCGESD